MKRGILFLLLLLNISVFGQRNLTKVTKTIVAEGKRLYRSEMASWYGTDIFLEKHKNKENIGGYFSYTENEKAKCIFFSKAENPKVIGTITFDSTYNTQTAKTELEERDFTKSEEELYIIRKRALDVINSDTLFKHYKNTSLNLIPLINDKRKKVYVLTGPQLSGVVIFGNDYLFTFDKKNRITEKKRLHNNILLVEYNKKAKEGEQDLMAYHTHLKSSGDYITATDICTLMLYERYTTWKRYNVISKKYLSVWDCSKNELYIIPKKTLDKINKYNEKRDEDKKDDKSK